LAVLEGRPVHFKNLFLHLVELRMVDSNSRDVFAGIKKGDVVFVEKTGGVERFIWRDECGFISCLGAVICISPVRES
jgi:hypothetical protein